MRNVESGLGSCHLDVSLRVSDLASRHACDGGWYCTVLLSTAAGRAECGLIPVRVRVSDPAFCLSAELAVEGR